MDDIAFIGETDFRGTNRPFGYTTADRRLHTWVLGKTGSGKSTLLKSLIAQDLRAGRGVAVIDLHGDLAREVLSLVPSERTGHVAYLSPVDPSPIGLNILERVPVPERHTVASSIVSIFKDVWGSGILARSEDILRNAVTALLDVPESTLLWIPRWIVDAPWREGLLHHVTDPVVRLYWTKEFAGYSPTTRSEYTAPILNKCRVYLTAPPLRHVFGQWQSKLDLRWVMDHRRILLIDLAKGRLGEDKASILGKLIVMKLCLTAFARIDTPEDARPDFSLFIDELQTVTSPVLAKALSELRKFHTSLVGCHQYTGQLPAEVFDAVKGNVGTMIVFRIGADDAEELRNEFTPEFSPQDLVNLGPFQAAVRLAVDGTVSRPFSARTIPFPVPPNGERRAEAILRASRERFGRPIEVVERWIERWYAEQDDAERDAPPRRGRA